MINFKTTLSLVAMATLFIGCASSTPRPLNINNVDFSNSKKLSMSDFEVNLLRVAAKAEKHQKDYYARLEKSKNMYDEKLHLHVPSGMGRVIDMEFEGYCGDLLDKLGGEAGYVVDFKDMARNSTPMTAIKYNRTSIWDIIQLTMAKIPDYGLKVDESSKKITVYPKY